MSIRVVHTADWHLGHTLHGFERSLEHERFLAWLLDLLAGSEDGRPADALLIAGDVFDSACPPVRAERQLYDFLAEARRRCPGLDVVVIGGNHDSAQRLEAAASLLRALGVHVVGNLPRAGRERALDTERLLVPLHDASGAVAAWAVAVPFLRPVDLPAAPAGAAGPASLVGGVRQVYAEAVAAARARRQPGQALIALGHGTLAGGRLSEQSERQLVIGGQHAIPADVFPADLAYVALGHLHKAQHVERESIRYAGSPLPLSMTEVDYRHEVRVLDLEGEALAAQRGAEIPRAVGMLRVPAAGPGEVDEVLEALRALPAEGAGPLPPYLEVRVRLGAPEPGLRRKVDEALEGRWARLVRLAIESGDPGQPLPEALSAAPRRLAELGPLEVFLRRYAQRHPDGEPSEPLLAAFGELLAQVQGEAPLPAARTGGRASHKVGAA